MSCRTLVFDGTIVRHGLCGDLYCSKDEHRENIRRIGEMAQLFFEAGVIALAAFLSPFRADRLRVRNLTAPSDFTGISSPYEEPENPELAVDTSSMPLAQCVDHQVIGYLQDRGVIPNPYEYMILNPLHT